MSQTCIARDRPLKSRISDASIPRPPAGLGNGLVWDADVCPAKLGDAGVNAEAVEEMAKVQDLRLARMFPGVWSERCGGEVWSKC
jgi:hypothetical protein